jgi:ElaB/YqjD/DUF883 family membrane-anchored ribosome-binding protein
MNEELNRIVEQAEALLLKIGEQTGEAADAVRDRVSHTLEQARARLADTAAEAGQATQSMADRADRYVRGNPWQAVAIAALLGSVLTLLVTRFSRAAPP